MKILVVSLLRIGDIFLSAPVLGKLGEHYGGAKVDLLVNRSCLSAAKMLNGINKIHTFDRDQIQRGLGDSEVAVFESYERLGQLLDEINSLAYDLVINLTHNRLSGWLMSLIDARQKQGLNFDANARPTFGNAWFRYLNEQVDFEGREVFHYADVFRLALGLNRELVPNQFQLKETAAGRAEADEFFHRSQSARAPKDCSYIAVQPLTSDEKKNWQLKGFTAALTLLARQHPEVVFLILAAPDERARLDAFLQDLQLAGVPAELAVFSLEGCFSALKRCRLLLTGDTSIKHLASAAKTKIVELSLGSSDLYRTGAFQHGSVIVQSKEACAPCVHSQKCHRSEHYCGLRIPADVVAATVSEVYAGRYFQLPSLIDADDDAIEIFRVHSQQQTFWSVSSVREPFSEASIGRWLDLTSRKIWLDGQCEKYARSAGQSQGISLRGTEISKLQELLQALHPRVSAIQWQNLLSDLEKQLLSVEGRMNGFRVGLQYLHGCYEDPKKMRDFVRGLISFRERIRGFPMLMSYRVALDQAIEDDISPAFTRFRRIQSLIDEVGRRTEISLCVVRGLMSSTEKQSQLEST